MFNKLLFCDILIVGDDMKKINFKKIKVIGIITIIIIVIVLIMYYLLFCRDLKCTRYAAIETPKEYLNTIVFKFNKFGKVINGEGERIYEFNNNKEAAEYKIIENKIIITYNEYEEINMMNQSRNQLKKIYKEYGYECK